MFFRRKSFMPGKSKDNKDTGGITKNKVKSRVEDLSILN